MLRHAKEGISGSGQVSESPTDNSAANLYERAQATFTHRDGQSDKQSDRTVVLTSEKLTRAERARQMRGWLVAGSTDHPADINVMALTFIEAPSGVWPVDSTIEHLGVIHPDGHIEESAAMPGVVERVVGLLATDDVQIKLL